MKMSFHASFLGLVNEHRSTIIFSNGQKNNIEHQSTQQCHFIALSCGANVCERTICMDPWKHLFIVRYNLFFDNF
uniref:Uncharacterized protein n=1 Tax=Arundo donax TaxID=35708 RepID=A0A0A9GZF7_ARUDO